MRRIVGFFVGAAAGGSIGLGGGLSVLGTALVGGLLGVLVGESTKRSPAIPPMPRLTAPAIPPMPAGSAPGSASANEPVVIARFLREALARGTIDEPAHERLLGLSREAAWDGVSKPTAERPPVHGSTTRPEPIGPRPRLERASSAGAEWHTLPLPAEPWSSRPEPPRRPPTQLTRHSPIAEWFERLREAVASDVAVHGLAYLGVFLVFAGTLGFMLFSFEELSVGARPLAELLVPTVVLGSAAFLRRRGAPVVATALGVVGGILLPIVLFASFVDGVVFPPEFTGAALGGGVIGTSLALATIYAAVGARWREVSVRYLTAPLVWTAAWGISLLLPDAPDDPLRSWTAVGFAFASVMAAATALAVRARPTLPVLADARPSLVPGALLSLSLTALLGVRDPDTAWTLVVAGLAVLVTSEAVSDRLGPAITRVAQPVLLWVAVYGVALRSGPDVAGPVLVIASLLLFEWQAVRRPSPFAMGMHAAAIVAGLLTCAATLETDPWSTVAATAPLAVWGHARRVRPVADLGRGHPATVVSAVAFIVPAAVVGGLIAALDDTAVLLATAGVAPIVAWATRLRRDDLELAWWAFGSVFALALGVALVEPVGAWEVTSGVAFCAAGLALPRVPSAARAWGVAGTASAAAWFAARAAGLSPAEATTIVAVGAAVAAVATTWWRVEVVTHIAAATWALSVAALVGLAVLGTDGWLPVIAVGSWSAASLIVAVAFEWKHAGAGVTIERLGESIGVPELSHVVSPAMTQLGLALSVGLAWHAAGLHLDRVVLAWATLALVEAGTTRAFRGRALAVLAAGIGIVLLASASVVFAAHDVELSAATLSLGVLAIAALTPAARPEPVTWLGWSGSAVGIFRGAEALGASPPDAAVVLAGWAALIGLGALVLDDVRAGRREPKTFVRTHALRPPAVVGLVTLVPAVAGSVVGSSDLRLALGCLAGAALAGAVAVVLRLGSVTLVSYALVTVAIATELPWSPVEHPWLGVVWSTALIGAGLALRPMSEARSPEERWDLPALAAAVVVVAISLGWAWEVSDVAMTWTAAGLLATASAIVYRFPWLAGLGMALVAIGAIDAGPGWGSLALALTSIVMAVAASRVGRDVEWRITLQLGCSILAATALVELRLFAGWSVASLGILAVLVAAVATVVSLALTLRNRADPWATQIGLLVLAMQTLAVGASLMAWPERVLLIAVLLIASGEVAAYGIVFRWPELLMTAPVLACFAWLVGIEGAIDGTTMWWAVPIGLTLVAIVGIGRWDRRHRGEPARSDAFAALEVVGMGTMMIPSLVESVTRTPGRGLVGIALGLGIAVWGVATKVRRRVFAGAGGVVGAVTLMLVGPIAKLVPRVEGPTLWIVLAVIGVGLIIVATSLERGRRRLAEALRRLDELVEDWE